MARYRYYKPEEAMKKLALTAQAQPAAVLRRVGGIYRIIQSIVSQKEEGEDGDSLGGKLAIEILEEFGTENPLIGRLGVEEVLDRISVAIRLIRTEVKYLFRDVVPEELSSEVSLHTDAMINSRPEKLLEFILPRDQGIPDDHKIHQAHLRSKHARVMLALGIIGFLLEAVDENAWIESDLNELAGAVTYTGVMRNVMVVASTKLNGKHSRTASIVTDSLRAFLSEEEGASRAHMSRMRAQRQPYYTAEFLCREAVVGDLTFYVYTNARAKDLLAKILKTLRSRKNWKKFLRDSRGIKDVVVAVRGPDGVLRAAKREDVQIWGEYVKECVYALPGIQPERFDKAGGATHGGPAYWDMKIYGRIIRRHGRHEVGGLFEWIVQPIGDYLHALVHASPDHHDIYVMKRCWLDLLPTLFPHRKWGEEDSQEYLRAFRRWIRIVTARTARAT